MQKHYCKGEVGEDELLQLLGSLETTDAGHFDYVTKATVFLNK